MKQVVFSIAFLIFAGSPLDWSCDAATVSISASKDTTIFQNNVTNSAGGQTQFYSGTNSTSSPRRALIAFDIAANTPAGATISAASLTLTLSQVGGGGGGGSSATIGLHEVPAAWGEGSVSAGGGQGSAAGPGD